MKFSNLLRRSLAMLVLLATLVALVPNVFAASNSGDIENIVIDVPAYLEGEDVVTATFGADGKITYDYASDEVRSAINGGLVEDTYADVTDMLTNRAGTDFSAGQRLAFFIDPSNSEGNSNYVTFSLTAAIVKNLVAAGVTDLFVMTKNRAGTFDMTNLKTANTNKGSAKVYAWMHCARDNAYLKNHHSATQYHFARGTSNAATDGANSNAGFVHLADSAYITYMEGLVGQATSYADGLLLDSVYFGTEFTGWNSDMKTYYKNNQGTNAATYYNEAVKAMCATAYTDYGTTYRYKADSEGYYYYVSSGGTAVTSGSTLAAYCTANSAGAKAFGNYRKSVVTNFIGKMKTKFGSSKIIAVALERAWENTYAYKYIHGQDPYSFRNHVKKGFCVTMQVVDYHTTAPVTMAKQVAKYTNVMIGVDFYKKGTVGNYGYTLPDTIVDLAETIYTARYDVNGAYATYRGSILGAACYTAGHIGAMKVTLSGSGASPTLTAVSAHPNQKTTAMMAYFNAHGDSDCGTQTTDGSLLKPSGSTIQYFANKNSSGNGAYGYIGSYSDYTGAQIAAFGASTIVVALKNYTVDWDKLPFARIAYYVPNSLSTTADTVGHFPIYYIKGHETCTSFTDTTLVTATCTAIGYKRRTCKTCGYDFIVEVAKLGHNYTVVQSQTPATCEAAGSVTKKCSRCTSTTTETIAALGHNYVATVTPATCISTGYTTYVCANDAKHTYIANETPMIEHSFVGGVCSYCGFSLATLIHFKANSVENTWDWQLIGGYGLDFDTSTDGSMLGTTSGMIPAYFYVDPMDIGNLDYDIVAGDVIQIRMRVKTIQSTAMTATPSVSLELASGTSYGATISGNAIDLTSNEWQIVTIPITGYAAGEIVERIRINPFGDELVAANVEIDYVHFGTADATPITVTFYNYRGKVLQTSMIAPGTSVEFYEENPTKPSSAGFAYTFIGWYATTADGTTSSVISDLSTVAFSKNTALTPAYSSVRVPTEPLDSQKTLVDNDGNLEDYKYDIEIEASTYGQTVTINKEYKKPLDITIVMDRSTSTAFPADESNTSMTWTVTNNSTSLTTALNKLDKTKPEGYYTATNWLGVDYVGPTDEQAGGYISYEDMRWNGTEWQVWQTIELYTAAKNKWTGDLKTLYPDGAYELVRPASVLYKYSNYTYHHSNFGQWVSMKTAYNDFFTRCKASFGDSWETSHGLSGYTQANMKFKIAVSRRGKMQEALTKFVDDIYASTSQLPQGQYHRISIVSYGYQAFIKNNEFTFTNASGSTGTYKCTVDPGVSTSAISLSSQTNVNKIKSIINNPFAFGATSTDDGLKFAAQHQTDMRKNSTVSQGVVILFTDGAPTYGDGFFVNTANAALKNAASMKSAGSKIFSVGYMDDLNSATAPIIWKSTDTIAKQANTFLHLVSSNYPSAQAMPETSTALNGLSGSATAGYYKSDATGANLSALFGQIYTITDTTTKADTQITGSLVIEDTVTREWDVLKNGNNWDVSIEKCIYKGLGEFADPVALEAANYTLTVTELGDGQTKISVEWKDAPNAWLREEEEATNGYMGYKILITIGIQLDRDSTIGGNNIPTNTTDSGIFYPNNHDLDHLYEAPNVNVEMIYDHKAHDYFLDLYNTAAAFDYLDILNNESKKSDYVLSIYKDFFSRVVDIDGLNNRFVNIEHFVGKDVYSIFLEHGKTTWAQTFYEPAFDFLTDTAGIPVSYEVTPLTNSVDSLGRVPFTVKKPVQSTKVNYYGPKYVVVDYGTDTLVPMGNENPDELVMTLGANGVFDKTNTKVMYTFRTDADSTTEAEHIMKGIEEIPYTVTAINQPKSASSKQISRKIHVIPANTVEYDFDLLAEYEYVSGSGYTGNWTEDGTDNALLQNYDNSERHGYDSTLVGATSNYSFGRSYVTTVSANIRNGNKTEYHNNDALTFNFVGTGFDIISQTGPEEGTMVVEVYAVDASGKASTTVTRRFFVDNYLSTHNLYQLPVVHCMDLPFGEYKVVVRAFYNDAMNHYTPANMVGAEYATKSANIMTEAKLRKILGLTKSDILEYTLSESRATATRGMTATSYDVHVDGVRIYNTLGALTASGTPVAYTIYDEEANAQFINARDILLDSANWISKVDSNGNMTSQGMVYIAGDAIGNTGYSADDGAIHLSMTGILNHQYADGKYYVLDSNDARVKHPDYNTDIYFKMNSDNTIVTATVDGKTEAAYFCLNNSGREVTITSQQFRKFIGAENIAFYNVKYDVAGPKNEVYLSDNYGLAFNASGATLLQVSLNSLEGEAVVLEAYDWSKKTFVAVTASITNAATMYYNLLSYMSTDGIVIIRNSGSGIISISNIKVIGAQITAPASTVSKALQIMQSLDLIQDESIYDAALKTTPSISVGAEMQIVYTIPATMVKNASDFYLEITEFAADGENVVTAFTLNGENQLMPLIHPASGEVVGYNAVFTGINAKEMGDEFSAVIYMTVDDVCYYGAQTTTSIKAYLMEKVRNEASSDELKTLAVDMLNYGAAAQVKFDYNVENLVNADLTEQERAYGTTETPDAVSSNDIIGEGVAIATDVALLSKVKLYLTARYQAAEDSELKFVVRDCETDEVIAELEATKLANNAYNCIFDNVGAKEMRRVLIIELWDRDSKVSKSVLWSVEGYVAETRGAAETNEAMRNMLNAMLTYGDSVAAYMKTSAR